MLIKNNGKKFDILYDGNEYHVPTGQFEVTEALGLHIQQKTMEWGVSIEIVDGAEDKQAITGLLPNQKVEEKPEVEEKPKEVKTKDEKPTETKKTGQTA